MLISKMIGFETSSAEIRFIKNAVFIVSFINNALLVMVMSANFEFTSHVFNGKYSDFNLDWFIDIGSIVVSSMTTTAIYPVIELAIFGGILYVKRALDQKTLFIERIPHKT